MCAKSDFLRTWASISFAVQTEGTACLLLLRTRCHTKRRPGSEDFCSFKKNNILIFINTRVHTRVSRAVKPLELALAGRSGRRFNSLRWFCSFFLLILFFFVLKVEAVLIWLRNDSKNSHSKTAYFHWLKFASACWVTHDSVWSMALLWLNSFTQYWLIQLTQICINTFDSKLH